MKLFASLTSPYTRKIRVLLAEKKIEYELVVDSPWESDSRIPDLNPLGKVPALETDDGEVFFDSPIIAAYIETLTPVGHSRLVPLDPLESVRVRQIEALADGIVDATVAAFLEGRRPEAQRSDSVIVRQREKIERGVARLDKLATGRTWLHGDNMSLGDIAAAVAVAYLDLRLPEIAWRESGPELAALSERMFERASFVDSAPPSS